MNTELLAKVKLMLSIADTSKDSLFDSFIDDAKEEVVNYCGLTEYNTKFNSTVVKMVLHNYTKLNTQGISSQSYSGVTENYIDGYSIDILSVLNANRRVKFI